ncbi:MAG: ATP-binding cassette domain-containing protein [Erysipelotrichaceae bacterium]
MELQITGLKKSFDKKEVLKDINYTFKSGKIYGLLVKNGYGKTTLFNCLSQDMDVDGGESILITNQQKKALETDDIGYVLSTPTVPSFLTGREFLEFFLEINKIPNYQDTNQYFEIINIDEDDRDKLMRDYSHGMKNKMQMLVNLLAKPNVLLLDEPLTSLDIIAAEEMKSFLRSMKTDRITIFSTHILDLAVDLCDVIVLLHQGVLEEIDKENISSTDFKQKILLALKEEKNV